EIEDFSPEPVLWPGEDPMQYQSLRDGLLDELCPQTMYQRLLVDRLVMLEWELFRYEGLIADFLKSRARVIAAGVLNAGEAASNKHGGISKTTEIMAIALFDPQDKNREKALKKLSLLGISLGEITALAYSEEIVLFDLLEFRKAEIDSRRRLLLKDFDALKAARRKPIEEAEVLGE
ncbi:MAG: hypothetical protein KAS85_07865, partial [Rhodobacteraceae bacterium]|nr:hypothetical protein [Paracoccaceae bacterium]